MNTSITNIDQAFADRKVDLNQMDSMFAAIPDRYRNDMALFFKKMVVTDAINEGKDLDWSDRSQEKYYPWWVVKGEKGAGSGVALSLYDVGCDDASADVAPRHTFFDEAGARHYAQNFKELDEMYYGKPKRKVDWTTIITIDQVLEAKGFTMEQIQAMHEAFPAEQRAAKIIEFRNDLIQDVINGEEKLDWSNLDQKKWAIYWNVNSAGSGVALSLIDVDFAYARAYVAPRPRFSSREKALHAAKYFAAQYAEEYPCKK